MENAKYIELEFLINEKLSTEVIEISSDHLCIRTLFLIFQIITLTYLLNWGFIAISSRII